MLDGLVSIAIGIYIGHNLDRISEGCRLLLPGIPLLDWKHRLFPPKYRIYRHQTGRYYVKNKRYYIGLDDGHLWCELKTKWCLGTIDQCRQAIDACEGELVESYP